jgi:hypothetical protein
MILAVTDALDSNDEVLPICWGLIPRENEYWWSWYRAVVLGLRGAIIFAHCLAERPETSQFDLMRLHSFPFLTLH